MQLQYFGNAMIMMEGKDSKVLCDPWVTFDTYSESGLFNFPELKMTKEEVANINPDFIYITHTHQDHFDPITLSLFDKNTPVLVSYYDDNFTERNVRALGFTDVRVSDPEKGIKLNGDDHCWLEPSEVYSDVDSIGVFKIDGQLVVNANDNPFHEGQCKRIKERFGEIDLACIPFSAQGPYPAFYENLDEGRKTEEASKKRLRAYDCMLGYARTLTAKYVFPFAAGAIYGGKKALLYPYYGVGMHDEAVEFLEKEGFDNLISLSQKNKFDVTNESIIGEYIERNYTTEQDYINKVANTPTLFDKGGEFYIAPSQRKDLTRLFAKARLKQQGWQERKGIVSDAVFFIDVGQEHLYRFCLADTTVEKVNESEITDEAYEIIRVPYSLMVGLLTAHYNYSNVKTQYMSFYRKPDVFNQDLHILLSYLQL